MSQSEHESNDVELGPLFTLGVLVFVYGFLRRRRLAIGAGLGVIWLDQRSELGRSLKRRFRSALKEQIKAHARSGPPVSDRAVDQA